MTSRGGVTNRGVRRHTYTKRIMTKITEEKLIESLKQLKEIKPNQEWASLLRSQVFLSAEASAKVEAEPARFAGFMNVFSQRQFAYSFAAILLLVAGAFGLVKLFPSNTAPQQTASLIGNVADLSTQITELQKNSNASSPTNLKTAKAVADDIQKIKQLQTKTLADVSGTSNEKALSNVLSLADSALAPLVQSEIADLQKTTLTADQQKILAQAQDLYNKADYSGALEKIWDLSNNTNNATDNSSLTNTTSPTNK